MESDEDGKRLLARIVIYGAIMLIAIAILGLIPSKTVSYSHPQFVEAKEIEVIEEPVVEVVEATTTETQVQIKPSTKQTLTYISYCESGHRQFNEDGTVLRNSQGSSAVGKYQIMESVWGHKAKELGYDIHTEQGNELMAVYILEVGQGVGAWEASNDCFRKNFGFIITNNQIIWI